MKSTKIRYELKSATEKDINLLIKHKRSNILYYAEELPESEIVKINNYVEENIPKQVKNYKKIVQNGKIIGSVLVEKYKNGYLLDEIFIEKDYRNQGIGTDLIRKIISKYKKVYLWVYKKNDNAYKLYKKLGFQNIDETETRYFMEYRKK